MGTVWKQIRRIGGAVDHGVSLIAILLLQVAVSVLLHRLWGTWTATPSRHPDVIPFGLPFLLSAAAVTTVVRMRDQTHGLPVWLRAIGRGVRIASAGTIVALLVAA